MPKILDLLELTIQDGEASDSTIYLDYQQETPVSAGFPTPLLPTETQVTVFKKDHIRYGEVVQDANDLAGELPGTLITSGIPYEAAIQPQTQYVRDASGKVNHWSQLRIVNWILHVINSADITASILSPFYTPPDQVWSGFISNSPNTTTDNEALNSDAIYIGYNQKAEDANLRLHTKSHLPLNITDIEWRGGHNLRGRRF